MTYQVVELLNEVAGYVKANEPGTLRYEIQRQANQSGDDEVIMIERLPTNMLYDANTRVRAN
jgi:hypothetical protein